jgi:signal transduction histidine kinase
MAPPPPARHDGAVVTYVAVLLVILGASYLAWRRLGGRYRSARTDRWALLLPVLTAAFAGVIPWSKGAAVFLLVLVAMAGVATVRFPRRAAKAVPFALLLLGMAGLVLARRYWDWATFGASAPFSDSHLYGLLPASNWSRWKTLVLPEALLFIAAGFWLLFRVQAPGAGLIAAAARWLWQSRGKGVRPGQELLLIPVVLIAILLTGPDKWGDRKLLAAVIVLMLAGAVIVFMLRSRLWAATVAAAGLLVLGGYGFLLAMFWPKVPGSVYGLVMLDDNRDAFAGGYLQGAVLLAAGLWLTPRVMGQHLGLREAELEAQAEQLQARAEQLTERVQTLAQTRTDAVDTAAAELRRIERDLHDGAQARLVALGMSLQAAERLFRTSPDAALALVSEAKQASSQALTELRDLVRGIYPPVLADRGLADAIRSLAMDNPLPTIVDIDLPGEVEMPVGSAVYFAVAETLTNAAKHTDAAAVRVEVGYQHGVLRAQVTDDGGGGADPEQGTGLKGIERRLATFDGILAVNSPVGGPTIVVIEVPCALSSAKTSSC